MYFITLPFLVRKIFTFYINYVLLFKFHFQGQRVKRVWKYVVKCADECCVLCACVCTHILTLGLIYQMVSCHGVFKFGTAASVLQALYVPPQIDEL